MTHTTTKATVSGARQNPRADARSSATNVVSARETSRSEPDLTPTPARRARFARPTRSAQPTYLSRARDRNVVTRIREIMSKRTRSDAPFAQAAEVRGVDDRQPSSPPPKVT